MAAQRAGGFLLRQSCRSFVLGRATKHLSVSVSTDSSDLAQHQGPEFDDYAVSPDGKRFLVKVPVGEPPEARLHVVTNWTSLLEE